MSDWEFVRLYIVHLTGFMNFTGDSFERVCTLRDLCMLSHDAAMLHHMTSVIGLSVSWKWRLIITHDFFPALLLWGAFTSCLTQLCSADSQTSSNLRTRIFEPVLIIEPALFFNILWSWHGTYHSSGGVGPIFSLLHVLFWSSTTPEEKSFLSC